MHTLKKAAFRLKEDLYAIIIQVSSYLAVEEQREQILMEQVKEIRI